MTHEEIDRLYYIALSEISDDGNAEINYEQALELFMHLLKNPQQVTLH